MTEELKKFAKQLQEAGERREGYAELGQQLQAHADRIEDRLHAFFLKALIAFAVIGLTSAIALFGFGYTINQLRDTRQDFTRTTCVSQNEKHDNTTKGLNAAAQHDIDHAKELGLNPEEVARRRDVTLGLIDLLAPHQDCEYLVKLSTGDVEPTPVPIPKTPASSTATKPSATETPRTP